MVERIHHRFRAQHGLTRQDSRQEMHDALAYNKIIGNAYTASLFISLASLWKTKAMIWPKRELASLVMARAVWENTSQPKCNPDIKSTLTLACIILCSKTKSHLPFKTTKHFTTSNSPPQAILSSPKRMKPAPHVLWGTRAIEGTTLLDKMWN